MLSMTNTLSSATANIVETGEVVEEALRRRFTQDNR